MGEDRILRTHLFDELKISDAYYVDVGAFHPVHHSNSYWFYQFGWSGITIEPNPQVEQLFRELRPRDAHLAAAVANEEGTADFLQFANPLHSTLDIERARKLCDENNAVYRIENKITVPTFSLSQILRNTDTKDRPFAFLSVDVEGKDLEVLKSSDWNKFRPFFVVAEDHAFDFTNSNDSEICRYLDTVGYKLTSRAYLSLIFQRKDSIA